jgi:hypothetical protein
MTSQPEPHSLRTPIPGWLRALGIAALAAIGAGASYAIAIAAANFSRIGV